MLKAIGGRNSHNTLPPFTCNSPPRLRHHGNVICCNCVAGWPRSKPQVDSLVCYHQKRGLQPDVCYSRRALGEDSHWHVSLLWDSQSDSDWFSSQSTKSGSWPANGTASPSPDLLSTCGLWREEIWTTQISLLSKRGKCRSKDRCRDIDQQW